MSRQTVIRAILSGFIMLYIIIMVPLTNRAERNDVFDALSIVVNDPEKHGFVTADDIDEQLGYLSTRLDSVRRGDINTLQIENDLMAFNRVESATCLVLNNGTLLITVKPFDPVARVFDPDGSVYVNSRGKRVPAIPANHVDVPVITSDVVTDSATLAKMLPLLRKLKTDARANALVSSLHFDSRGDIIIMPNVLGHVINFGDSTRIDDKLARLQAFYRDVMPVRGWTEYDTLSVKWAGRIVAKRHNKSLASHYDTASLDIETEEIPEEPMTTTEQQY